MEMLQNSYNIQDRPALFWPERRQKYRDICNVKLKEAIRELFLQQACEDF